MIIETEREEDGRWIAELPELSGVMSYGDTREDAISKVKALALRVFADRLEHGEFESHESGGVNLRGPDSLRANFRPSGARRP
jgi:predicted RNase H-like HicB family nuclease